MIHVPKPQSLIPPAWKPVVTSELKKVLAHYHNRAKKPAAFKFSAYKHWTVKDVLIRTFNNKCAYCEFNASAGFPLHVDHWRPKGSVTQNKKTFSPGYYWLAADWDNLFPACAFCNSANLHEYPDRPPAASGKQDQFPLLRPHTRPPKKGHEHRETALLLNPSIDDPSDHLVFLTEGDKRGLIQPKLNRQKQPSLKGKHSIEVYALQRKGLVDERRLCATKLIDHLREVNIFASRVLKSPRNKQYQGDLRRTIELMRSTFLEPAQPYLAIKWQIATNTIAPLWKKHALRPYLKPLQPFLPGLP